MQFMKHLPSSCPACSEPLRIVRLKCAACETAVEGDFAFPALAQLPSAEQQFVLRFVLCSGSLKEMAREMGLSYPTVRNKLDDIIDHLKNLAHEPTR